MKNITESLNTGSGDTAGNTLPQRAATRREKRAKSLMAERKGLLPVWIRAPKSGPEHYTGFSRAKLYELAKRQHIRTGSITEPGQIRGTRLFELESILTFIESRDCV